MQNGANFRAFIDNYASGTPVGDIPVLSPEYAKKYITEDSSVIIAIADITQHDTLSLQALKFHSKHIYYAKSKLITKQLDCIADNGDFDGRYIVDLQGKPIIFRLETHIVDHCNLDCRGCSNFSNIADPHMVPLPEYEKNIKRLSELFPLIHRLIIMGGEPLLNPNFSDYLAVARKYYPHSYICIITNGILLDKISQRDQDVIRENDITIEISLYSYNYKIKDQLIQFLDSVNLPNHRFVFGGVVRNSDEGVINNFMKRLLPAPEPHDLEHARNCRCYILYGSKISKCSTAIFIDRLNRRFETSYPVSRDDYKDIFKESDSIQLLEWLRGLIPLCDYCANQPVLVDWSASGSDPSPKDWII